MYILHYFLVTFEVITEVMRILFLWDVMLYQSILLEWNMWGRNRPSICILNLLRLTHTYHAVSMPFSCRAHVVPLRVQIVSFPFDLHSADLFDSHMPHGAHAAPMPRSSMPRTCRSESDFSRPLHSPAWVWYVMCELASAAQRRHVGDLPAFGFFRLPRGVPRRLLSEAYQSVKL
jgi:hypothetical protein